jgi:hypothetical protein
LTRNGKTLALKPLKSVQEHGTIDLLENVQADVYSAIRANAENVLIVRRVVELAEGKSIRDERLPEGMLVRKDVRGVQKLPVAQTTNRAAFSIRSQHTLAEPGLMEPVASLDCHVGATSIGALVSEQRASGEHRAIVDRYVERQMSRIVSYDIDWPLGQVPSRNDSTEIDQRGLPRDGLTQAYILMMHRIRSAVPIQERTVGPGYVIVRCRLTLLGRGGGDGQRNLGKDSRLEDPLRSEEGNPMSTKREAPAQDVERDGFLAYFEQAIFEKGKCCQPYGAIQFFR